MILSIFKKPNSPLENHVTPAYFFSQVFLFIMNPVIALIISGFFKLLKKLFLTNYKKGK